ncbi:MAG: AAA family ATPase, partial [Thermoprotei archaeon]
LRGRTASYMLLPFSFREFLRAKGVEDEGYMTKDREAVIRGLLAEYMEYGGFPDVVLSENKLKILREYLDLILFRDFVDRHSITNLTLAKFMFNFFVQNYVK